MLEILGQLRTKYPEAYAIQMEHLFALLDVLSSATKKPFTVTGRISRENAFTVALCASEGFLTTKLDENGFSTNYSTSWQITEEGVEFKENLHGILNAELDRTNPTD